MQFGDVITTLFLLHWSMTASLEQGLEQEPRESFGITGNLTSYGITKKNPNFKSLPYYLVSTASLFATKKTTKCPAPNNKMPCLHDAPGFVVCHESEEGSWSLLRTCVYYTAHLMLLHRRGESIYDLRLKSGNLVFLSRRLVC